MEEREKLAEAVGELLRRQSLTLAVAESCTGGFLGAAITAVPGSSNYFLGGVIAYHNRLKKKLLGVPATTLRRCGAVSAETAAAMAKGVRKVTSARVGLAVTGIAGPGGGSPQKPVGLVFIGLDSRRVRRVESFLFSGSRAEIRNQAVEKALFLLKEFLEKA